MRSLFCRLHKLLETILTIDNYSAGRTTELLSNL